MSITNDIQKLYIGYLGRAADQAGLDYWVAKVNSGWNIQTVAQSFADQPEYDSIYGTSPTRAQLVHEIYLQLFGREPDASGFDYWVNGGGKTVPEDLLVLAFYNAASAADQLIVDNKVEVAAHYTDVLGDAATYDQQDAQDCLIGVTGDSATVDQAIAAIDAGHPGVWEGQTFTLTTGLDEITVASTVTVDTVKGVVDYDGTDDNSTLSTLDTINGNGMTVLQIAVADINSASYTADYVELSGVDKLDIKDAAGAGRLILDASSYGTDISDITLSGAGGMDLSVTDMDVTGSLTISAQSTGWAYASGDIDGLDFSATVSNSNGASTATFGVAGITIDAGKDGYVDVYMAQTDTATSAAASVGDLTIGDINAAMATDASVTVTISNYASASVSGNATVGNLTLGDINLIIGSGNSATYEQYVYNSASAAKGSATVGNLTIGNVTAEIADSGEICEFYHYNTAYAVTGNAKVGDLTVGDITLTMGDSATASELYFYNSAYASVKGTATTGNVVLGDVIITAGDSASVSMYAYNDAGANGTDKAAIAGDLTVGAFNATVGNDAYIYVSMSNSASGTGNATAGDIAVGDITIVAGSDADLYFTYENSAYSTAKAATTGTVTLGAVDVEMGLDSEFSLYFYNTASGSTASAAGDMTVGAIDIYAGADAYVNLEFYQSADEGNAGNVTFGDVAIEIENEGINGYATAYFSLSVTGEDVGDVTIGNISLTGHSNAYMSASIDISATDNNIGAISIGDVTLDTDVSGTGYFYLTAYADNDAGNISYGNIVFDASATSAYNYGYIYHTADYGMMGDITMGDITLTAGESATAELYAYFSASDEIGNVQVGDIMLDADGDSAYVELYHEVYNSDDIGTLTYGDITVSAKGDDAYGFAFISAENNDNNDIGVITVGDVFVAASGDSAFASLSMSFTSADNIGLATVGNVAIDLATTDAALTAASARFYFESDAGDVTIGDISLTAAPVTTADYVATAIMNAYVYLTADTTDGILTVGDISVVGGLENSATVADNFGNLTGWLNLSGDTINIGNIDYSGYEAAATIDLTGSKGAAVILAAQDDTDITLNGSQNAVTLDGGDDNVTVAKNTTGATAQATIDSITGFTSGSDTITVDLAASDFAFGGTAASYDAFLAAATSGSQNNGYEIYAAKVGSDTFVAFNASGDYNIDFVVKLTGVASVDAADFIVV